jgi:hypothetical protein
MVLKARERGRLKEKIKSYRKTWKRRIGKCGALIERRVVG